jgi:hypothetical protein
MASSIEDILLLGVKFERADPSIMKFIVSLGMP